MASAAVAVCETLESYALSPVIKWANDIHVNGKKICGILIENTFSGDKISSSVVGIGLKVSNPLSEELLKIATTMQAETGKTFSVDEVTKRLVDALHKKYTIQDYQKRLGYMHTQAELILADKRVPATLLSVDDEGGLLVEVDGETRRFVSAEVSVKTL